MNLYRDIGDPANVNYIEEKFSELEAKAAHLINQVHDARPQKEITIKRKQLETLRKFIFLMHYRKASHAASYFSQDHPENAPLVAWIRKFKEKTGFEHDFEVWLFGMRYYLDTPHHALISTAEELNEKYGLEKKLVEMKTRTQIDADFENWHAMEYESTSNNYILGIWEAADGEEFVLGSNSFGLWEGLLLGAPGAHRLYVVSPQLAIILRNVLLQLPELRAMANSSLSDIVLEKASTHYATSQDFSSAKDEKELQEIAVALAAYRATPQAQSDRFTFQITKLTPRQTHEINEATMLNINPNGSLTFCSPISALNAFRAFMASKDPFAQQRKKDYSALHKELTSKPPPTANSTPSQDSEDKFKLIVDSIVSGAMEFKSQYDRAHRIFCLLKDNAPLSNPMAVEIRKLTGTIVELWTGILGAPQKNHKIQWERWGVARGYQPWPEVEGGLFSFFSYGVWTANMAKGKVSTMMFKSSIVSNTIGYST